jgi:hypothetical protein
LAARDAAQTDAFMREVDEALREDQMKSALKRWGLPAGIAVVVALGGLGGGLWYRHHQQTLAEDRGIAITRAIDQIEGGRIDLATASLDAVAKGDGAGSAALAKLIQAGIAMQQSKTGDAVKLYDAVAADAAAPQPLRDLATVRGVAAAFDTLGPDKALERLKPLAVPGNPWFGPAGELAALAYLKQGKSDQAGTLLREIAKDKDTPDTLKARARQLAGLLGFDSIDDIARAPEEAHRLPPGRPLPRLPCWRRARWGGGHSGARAGHRSACRARACGQGSCGPCACGSASGGQACSCQGDAGAWSCGAHHCGAAPAPAAPAPAQP